MNQKLDALRSQMESASKKTFDHKDSADYFQAKDGAIVRYLPTRGEDSPYIGIDSHAFKGPNGWFIEGCPHTIQEKCFVCDATGSNLWTPAQKVRHYWVSNAWVLKDPTIPSKVGRVMLYKFGLVILRKLGDCGFDPFSVTEGAAFQVSVSQGSFPDYSGSTFLKQSPIVADDDVLAALLAKCFSLQAIVDPSNFKSYEQLQEKYQRVMSGAKRI